MKVWVTRERKGHDLAYLIYIWEVKPLWTGVEWISSVDATISAESMKAKGFSKFFGFTPRKGSIGQYELTLKAMGE